MLRFLSHLLRQSSSPSRKVLLPFFHRWLVNSSSLPAKMDLYAIIEKLEDIAPTSRAESWDNVGLLVEPRQCSGLISRVLLTNDLTELVMDEVEKMAGDKVGLILSYHPPIFRPLKRITQSSSKERILLRAVESGIAVYSPHTALDPVINQWLLAGLGEGETSSLAVGKIPTKQNNRIQLSDVTPKIVREFCGSLSSETNVTVTSNDTVSSGGAVILCGDGSLAELLPKLKKCFPNSEMNIKSNEQYDVHLRGGMKLTLSQPLPLSQLVLKVKQHLNLPHVRLASPFGKGEDPLIKTVSTCAGSGGSVLSGVKSDLYLTGEMSHHNVLDACSRGTAVILCDHTNTERGYLQQIYKGQLEAVLGGNVQIVVSKTDRDPLQIV